MHRRQTQYLTPLLIPQLPPHHTAHPTPNRLPALINQHTRIIIKSYYTPIRALQLLLRAHDDGVADVAAADLVGGGDGDGAPTAGFGAEGALFLDDDYDAVAWEEKGVSGRGRMEEGRGGEDVPIWAWRFILRTLTHSATAAPELSITLTMVWRMLSVYQAYYGWETVYLELDHPGDGMPEGTVNGDIRYSV